MRKLYESLQQIVLDHGDIKSLVAEAFGTNDLGKPHKSHWTLYREINPDDREAKLGVIDAVNLMRATGDHRPLVIIADLLGYDLVARTAVPDKGTLHAEMLDDYPAVCAMHEAMDEEQPVEVVLNIAAHAHDEIRQTVEAYKCTQKASGRWRGPTVAPHVAGGRQ